MDNVLITITGFLATAIAVVGPILKLTNSITELNASVKLITKRLDAKEKKEEEVDSKLLEHEIRIDRLEHK